MMAAGGNKLAELFVDITLRGGGAVQVLELKKKVDALKSSTEAAERAATNSGAAYSRTHRGRMLQLEKQVEFEKKIADAQKTVAALDYKAYGSQRYKSYLISQKAANAAAGSAQRAMGLATEYRDFQANSVNRGQMSAVVSALWNRFKTGNTATGGLGGGALGTAASVAGAAGKAALPVAAIAAAVSAGVGSAIRLAAGASDNAQGLLSGSWKMLTNEIGTALLPMLVEFSRGLQQATFRLREIINSPVGNFIGGAATATGRAGAFAMNHPFQAMLAGNMLTAGPFSAYQALQRARGVSTDFSTAAAGGNGQPMLASSSARASFSSIEDAWRRIQQEAASGGSLEAELLRQQIIANERLAQLVGYAANPPQPGNV